MQSSLKRLVREYKGNEVGSSKNFKSFCETKKNFACTRFEIHQTCESNEVKKQEEHVPRHIELTAVLKRQDKNESNRIERFE
jgi:hypothetical protein